MLPWKRMQHDSLPSFQFCTMFWERHMGAPQLYLNQKRFFNAKNTNLITRLPFMRFRPLICFLLLEFSQNWGRWRPTCCGEMGKIKAGEIQPPQGLLSQAYRATSEEKHRAVGALEKEWLILPVGRKGKEEKGNISRLSFKKWEGFP